MLVTENGTRIGTVSGGCLEADVASRAISVIQSGQCEIALYDSSENNGDLTAELGCKGAVGILIEPASGGDHSIGARAYLQQISCWHADRRVGVIATVLQAEGSSGVHRSDRFALASGEENIKPLGAASDASQSLMRELYDEMRSCIHIGRAAIRPISGGKVTLLLEPVLPPIALTIAGGGHDAPALARAAARLGWYVALCASRPLLNEQAASEGWEVLVDAAPDRLIDKRPMDALSAVVIMNHNLDLDEKWLELCLATEAGYIGLLGPKKRTAEMLTRLGLAHREREERLHGPVGLDIGAETPEEIAVSVVAEISAVMRGASAGFLRESGHPIHPHTDTAVFTTADQKRPQARCTLAK